MLPPRSIIRAAVAASSAVLLVVACNAADRRDESAGAGAGPFTASAPSAPPAVAPRRAMPADAASEVRAITADPASAPASDALAGTVSGQGSSASASLSQFGPGTPSGIPAMLVRTGHASLQVDSLDVALAHIRAGAQRVGGYVAGTQLTGGEVQRREATVQLRVPSARFDEVVAGLSPLGKVENLTVETQDVGEEYADIEARIANARKLEQRLIDLLANRTGKLSDVLTVERELARVREDIERMEGRMRYLANRASFSSLTLAVHEPLPILAQRPNATRIGAAFREAWNNFVDVVAAIISMLGVLVPLAAVLGALVWGGRRWLPAVRRAPVVDAPKSA
jgi:hypothetical protein